MTAKTLNKCIMNITKLIHEIFMAGFIEHVSNRKFYFMFLRLERYDLMYTRQHKTMWVIYMLFCKATR